MADEPKKNATADSAKAPAAGNTGAVSGKGAEEVVAPKKRKKGKKRTVQEANVSVQASYNNTIVTVAELNGNVIAWASAGSCGFKGTRKATPYAASVAAETALNKAKLMGVERVHVSVKGTGSGRDQALRAISATGVSIETLKDKTAVAHNGCRARKARRV